MITSIKYPTLMLFFGFGFFIALAIGQDEEKSMRWVHVGLDLSDSVYLKDVDCPSPKVCYAVGNHHSGAPIIYKSIDSGDFWWKLPFAHKCLPTQAKFLTNDTGYLSCGDGFFITGNGGEDWDSLSTQGLAFQRFVILNRKKIVGVSYGIVAISIDEGKTWRFREVGLRGNIKSLSFPDSLHGFGVGLLGVWKTIDGGETWSPLDTTRFRYLNGVDFPTKDTGFIVGDDEHVYKTSDGGRNWFGYQPYVGRRLTAVTFFNSKVGFIAGNGVLYGTVDGGEIWIPSKTDGGGQMTDIFLTGSESGIIVGLFNRILRLVGIQAPGYSRQRMVLAARQGGSSALRRDILGRYVGLSPLISVWSLPSRHEIK